MECSIYGLQGPRRVEQPERKSPGSSVHAAGGKEQSALGVAKPQAGWKCSSTNALHGGPLVKRHVWFGQIWASLFLG